MKLWRKTQALEIWSWVGQFPLGRTSLSDTKKTKTSGQFAFWFSDSAFIQNSNSLRRILCFRTRILSLKHNMFVSQRKTLKGQLSKFKTYSDISLYLQV